MSEHLDLPKNAWKALLGPVSPKRVAKEQAFGSLADVQRFVRAETERMFGHRALEYVALLRAEPAIVLRLERARRSLAPAAPGASPEMVAALRAIVRAQSAMLFRILVVLEGTQRFHLGPKGRHRNLPEEIRALLNTVPKEKR